MPKGIQAIRTQDERCAKRFLVGADALFEFDNATLTSDVEETLTPLVSLLAKAGKRPATVEGHTDAKGFDAYSQTLSEKRAQAVKDWICRPRLGRAAGSPAGIPSRCGPWPSPTTWHSPGAVSVGRQSIDQ